jgi:hypothetical protein
MTSRAPWTTGVRVLGSVIAAGAVAVLMLASGTGARAPDGAPNRPAVLARLAAVADERDALIERVAALEAHIQAHARATRPAGAPTTLVRRWIEPGETAGSGLRVCARIVVRDDVSEGEAIARMWDACGELELPGGGPDAVRQLETLLRDELIVCWMGAPPDEAMPDCLRRLATERTDIASGFAGWGVARDW